MGDEARDIIQLAFAYDVPVPAHEEKGDDEQCHDQHAGRCVAGRYLTLQHTVDGNRTDGNADGENGQKQAGNFLVRTQHIFGERWKLDEKNSADGPEKADRGNRQIELADVHRAFDEIDRRTQDMPVQAGFFMFGRCRRDLPSGEIADDGSDDDAKRSPFHINDTRQYGAEQNGDIGPGLHQTRAAKHFVFLQMLR